jgi:predicted nucleic acid-binding protein
MIVVDASVAAKWFLPEADSAIALDLRRRPMAGPSLLTIEIAAALTKAVRHFGLHEDLVGRSLASFDRLTVSGALEIHPNEPLRDRAVEMSLRHRHPLQDCLYLALAERLECPLVTADRRFAERVRESHPFVRALPDSA